MFFSLMMDGSFTNEQAIKAVHDYLKTDTDLADFMKTPEGVFHSNCYFLESSILPEINDFMGERVTVNLPLSLPVSLTTILRMCTLAFPKVVAEILGDLFTIGLFKIFDADLPGINETQAEYYRRGKEKINMLDEDRIRNSEDTLKRAIPNLLLSANFRPEEQPDIAMMQFSVPRALDVYESIIRSLVVEQKSVDVARSTSIITAMCVMYGIDKIATEDHITPMKNYHNNYRPRLVQMHKDVREMALKGGDVAAQ